MVYRFSIPVDRCRFVEHVNEELSFIIYAWFILYWKSSSLKSIFYIICFYRQEDLLSPWYHWIETDDNWTGMHIYYHCCHRRHQNHPTLSSKWSGPDLHHPCEPQQKLKLSTLVPDFGHAAAASVWKMKEYQHTTMISVCAWVLIIQKQDEYSQKLRKLMKDD